jgi:hypothetical protein
MRLSKQIFIVVVISLISFALSSCRMEDGFLEPMGNIVTVNKSFSNYSEISVSSGFQLYLKQDGTESVEIETNDNLLPYIVAYQKGRVLTFERDNRVNFSRNSIVRIYVSAKTLSALSASGGSSLRAETAINSDNLGLNFSGGSRLKAEINSESIFANISGGSTFDFSGKSNTLILNGSGGSIVNGSSHQTESLTAEISGGSILNLTVNKTLSINVSGGSIINYSGNGVIISSIVTGGSRVLKN